MQQFYGLKGEPISLGEWGLLLKSKEKIVCQTVVGKHWISTVWLGLDHAFGPTPLIFETMVFCRDHTCGWDNQCWRYTTKAAAEVGHGNMCNAVTGERDDEQEGL